MSEGKEINYRVLRNALRRLLSQPNMMQKLKSQDTAKETMKELRIDSENERIDILNIMDDIIQHSSSHEKQPENTNKDDLTYARSNVSRLPKSEITDARTFFTTAFSQLQRAYRTSMFMSVTMFIIGISFLFLAAWQALSGSNNVATASVVGGIGIVQIVALFYRNPLADIARTVSNAQQAKIAITSYIIGVTLLNDSIGFENPSEKHIHTLIEITDTVIKQMQENVEDHGKIRSRKKKNDTGSKVVESDSQP